MSKPKIAIIIGSTRDTRFADKPAAWLLENARKRDDMDFELVDIRDYDLPMFNEVASNLWVPSADPRGRNRMRARHRQVHPHQPLQAFRPPAMDRRLDPGPRGDFDNIRGI